MATIHEFNILNYSNIANASAANAAITVQVKWTDDEGFHDEQFTGNFIQHVWNHMAADPAGRKLLKRFTYEMVMARANVHLGIATYEEQL